MNRKPHPAIRIVAGIVLAIPLALVVWQFRGPGKLPDLPRWQKEAKRMEAAANRKKADADARFVRMLLAENLEHRDFPFATVAEACSGKKVIPLDGRESHQRVKSAIEAALDRALKDLSAESSPVHSLRRINEASRHFEDALMETLNAAPDLTCEVPHNRRGESQRSGYPDLRITYRPTGEVFYLDPKLVDDGAWTSTLRTFYFTPRNETLKITDNAVHLLAGIGPAPDRNLLTPLQHHMVAKNMRQPDIGPHIRQLRTENKTGHKEQSKTAQFQHGRHSFPIRC